MSSLEALFCDVDDRRPIPDLLEGLFGKFFADRSLDKIMEKEASTGHVALHVPLVVDIED